MGRHRVSWRVWAVLVCLQLAAVCVDGEFSAGSDKLFTGQRGFSRNLSEDNDHGEQTTDRDEVVARGKKKKKLKYLIAILLGAAIVKGILIPIAIKAVAILAKKAFLLSSFSLILSAILGFKKLASAGWDRMGQIMMMKERGEVTEIPYHPIPTEAMYHRFSTDQYWGRDFKSK